MPLSTQEAMSQASQLGQTSQLGQNTGSISGAAAAASAALRQPASFRGAGGGSSRSADNRPSHVVYKFVKGTISVDGTSYPLVNFQITQLVNALPQLSVAVAVEPKDSVKVGHSIVSRISLAPMVEVWKQKRVLVSKAKRKAKVVIELEDEYGASSGWTFTDWLIIGVSIPIVSSTQISGLVFTLVHPAYAAFEMPGTLLNYDGAMEFVDPKTTAGAAPDLVDAAYRSMRAYHTATEPAASAATTMADIVRARQQYLDAVTAFKNTIEWDPEVAGKFPNMGTAANQQAVASTVWWYFEGADTADMQSMFLGNFLSDYHLVLYPDISAARLRIGPFAPWAEPTYDLSEIDIIGLSMGYDANPINGVDVIYDKLTPDSDYTDYITQLAAGAVPKVGAAHVEPDLTGTIVTHGPHMWMTKALTVANTDGAVSNFSGYAVPGAETGASVSAVDGTEVAAYDETYRKLAKQLFTERYRQAFEISVDHRFAIHYLTPGKVVRIWSKDDVALMSFFLTRVTTSARAAGTVELALSGTHVRAEGEVNLISIPGGVTDNYLYV